MKSNVAGVAYALFVQYPIALAFLIIPVAYGSGSISRGIELIAFFWVTVVALPIIIALGLPAFHWMRGRKINSNRNMLIGGGLIAIVLAAALTWPTYPGEGWSSGQNYYGTYREMIINGVPTIWGWIRFAEDLVMFAIHGALGAACFRIGWLKFSRQISEAEPAF